LVISTFGAVQNEQDSISEDGSALFLLAIRHASDSLQKIAACYDYGMYLNEQGELGDAMFQLENALRIAENIQNHKEIAAVANSLASMCLMNGDLELSIQVYLKALESAEITGDNTEIAKINMNLAGNYNFYGDYNNAIKYGLRALEIKESTNNLVRICYHYMAMSNIFKEMGNLTKREEYVLRAYKMMDVEGCASSSDIAKIYNGLGGIAEQQFQHEKALAYYDTLMILSKEANFNPGINTSLMNSSQIYQELGQYEKALEMILEADTYSDGNPYDIVFSNNCKLESYFSLGETHKALELAKENIQKEEIVNYSAERLKCLRFLYEINFSLGNYQEAYNWNDSLRVYSDYLHDEDLLSTMEELETKYQTEKKEQEIELLTAENQIKQQQVLVFVALSIVALLILAVAVLLSYKKRRQQQLQQLSLRQQLLRSQMNPHFLFNALGSIQNFMYKNETKKAAGYLGNFARLTRSILEHSAEEFVSLYDEIEMLRNYIELEKMRLSGKFDYEIEIDENIETEFVNVPPMLLQPFVENAIKHGFKKMESGGFLSLKFKEKEDVIYVEMLDNGVGIEMASKQKSGTHRSMSMQIFDERRKVLARKTKRNIECKITDLSNEVPAGQGTKVEVQIPIG
jgi:tetratricopeptide (TPR) repeat protein